MAEQPQQYARCNKCLLNVFIIIQATIDMVQNSNMVHLFGAIISILHRTLNHKLIKAEPHARNRGSQFFFFSFRQCHRVARFLISKTRYRAVNGRRPAHADSHPLCLLSIQYAGKVIRPPDLLLSELGPIRRATLCCTDTISVPLPPRKHLENAACVHSVQIWQRACQTLTRRGERRQRQRDCK